MGAIREVQENLNFAKQGFLAFAILTMFSDEMGKDGKPAKRENGIIEDIEMSDKKQRVVFDEFAAKNLDRNISRSSRLNSQGNIGTPRIRQGQAAQGEKGCCEMKGLGVNCFRCRVMRYDGQVGFTKLDSAEIPCSKKKSAVMGAM